MTMASDPSVIALLRDHSLTGVLQREIERLILSGEFAAGSRLNENALAQRLSVSRGPIREACRGLVELGFLELIPNRGVFVRRFERTDAIEVYDLRAGITGLACSLLAPQLADAQAAQLDGFIAEMEEAAASSDFEKFTAVNLAFHDFIVEATGNSRLARTYRGLVKEFQLFRSHGLVQSDSLLASNAEHRTIVRALKSRDPMLAYETSFRHVQQGKQRMLSALEALAKSTQPSEQQPVE